MKPCEGCGAEDYTQIRTLYYLMTNQDNPLCPKCISDLDEMTEENEKDWEYELFGETES
jgi:hypothetical protein